MSAELWVQLCGVLLTAGGAVFAWVQANAAIRGRDDARKAQKIAEQHAQAAARQANALEVANEIASAVPPVVEMFNLGSQNWELVNTGVVHLSEVRLGGRGQSQEDSGFPLTSFLVLPKPSPSDLAPGDRIKFRAGTGTGGEATVRLTAWWDQRGQQVPFEQEWSIPIYA